MVEICPFCRNDYYTISNPVCRGCGGEIKGRMYCPNCNGYHIFTVKESSVGCWCCNKIYNSSREYDEFKRDGQGPSIEEINSVTERNSSQNIGKKATKKKIQDKKESKKPDEEETKLERNVTIEKEYIPNEEESSNDIDFSEILNYLEQFSVFFPKLEEKRKHLRKRAREIKGRILDVESSILKLEEEKTNLHDEIGHLEDDIVKIDKIFSILQRLVSEEKPILAAV